MRYSRLLLTAICLNTALIAMGCHSQPPASEGNKSRKMEISMMYPMNLKHFEQLVETEYPDIDLKIEMTTTAAMNGDSERRLRNGHGTDLVVTTLPTGEVGDYVMDLSAETLATVYQGSVSSPVMIEGQTRYIPLPGQYEGYILNRTLTEELGKQIPTTNTELSDILKAGKEQGKGIGEDKAMFGLTTVSPDSVGTYIIGTQVPDFLGTAEGIKWMSDFNAGTAGFSGIWDDKLGLLEGWVSEGYLTAGTLSLKTKNAMPCEDRMLGGTLMLSYGNVQMFTKLNSAGSQYEFIMLPYLSDEENAPWVISRPDGYIGINRALENDKSRLEACIRILNLLSTPEGQEAWMEDTAALYSYLVDYKFSQAVVPEGIADCVEQGYIYDLQMPSNIIRFFGKNMSLVLDCKTEIGDALALVDDYCRNGSSEVDYDQSVVGSVEEDLIYENYNTRREETAIGNLVADAVKEYCGSDIAVINGGGIRASLYEGDVRGEDLDAVCPYPNKLIVVKAKGTVIEEMLQNGISQTVRDGAMPAGRFLQVSGLCYSYRPLEGEKPAALLSVSLPDGSELEDDTWYTLAITDYMAGSNGYLDNNGDGYTMLNLYSDTTQKAKNVEMLKEMDATYAEALRKYFKNHSSEPIRAGLEGRIIISGEEHE